MKKFKNYKKELKKLDKIYNSLIKKGYKPENVKSILSSHLFEKVIRYNIYGKSEVGKTIKVKNLALDKKKKEYDEYPTVKILAE